jgi:hypothetical protein
MLRHAPRDGIEITRPATSGAVSGHAWTRPSICEDGRDHRGRLWPEEAGMLWLTAGLWLVAVCILLALGVAAIDEYRRPPANGRRTGALLALVASFASLWLLLRPPSSPAGWSETIAGIAAAVVAVGAVLVTRGRG